jgi:CubicO group peptidase (beta-lactamase class C family)
MVSLASAAMVDEASLDAELAAVAQSPEAPLASLSVAVVRDGRIVYRRQWGGQRLDPATGRIAVPATEKTLYRVASISKLVTTLGALRLVESGKLTLDGDISAVLGYPVRNPHFPEVPITLRMLLSHTSSLRDDAGYYWEAPATLQSVLQPGGERHGTGAMWSKSTPPGAGFCYANLPWGVVGTLMERATGERFDRLMQRLVLRPLGLKGGFHPADFDAPTLARTATLYRKRQVIAGREVWRPDGPWVAQVDDYSGTRPVPRAGSDYRIGSNGTAFSPQGGARLSAVGLARIGQMLINGGALDGRRLLRPQTVDLMLSAQWPGQDVHADCGDARQLFNSWGLGVQRFIDRTGAGRGDRLVEGGGFTAVGHLGDAYGLTSALVLNRERRVAMVYLVGGVGFDPQSRPGIYSGLHRYEEQILTAMFRRALQ